MGDLNGNQRRKHQRAAAEGNPAPVENQRRENSQRQKTKQKTYNSGGNHDGMESCARPSNARQKLPETRAVYPESDSVLEIPEGRSH